MLITLFVVALIVFFMLGLELGQIIQMRKNIAKMDELIREVKNSVYQQPHNVNRKN